MNKKERHERIKQMVQTENVATQEEIRQRLEAEGVLVTQATLSRDLRELSLMKARYSDGKLYYRLSIPVSLDLNPRAYQYILKVSRAGFMLVLHTSLGEADVLANIIDSDDSGMVLGTIAGADTLLVICQDEQVATRFEREIKDKL
ncbi:arginine repressor [Streptococcus sp. zg-JUN1979]|uniref:arginine repressor n=1 Tax=Streptococcus sp. zg-JUN1979 TaxID=3391450 RepID=UPI0039A5A8C5